MLKTFFFGLFFFYRYHLWSVPYFQLRRQVQNELYIVPFFLIIKLTSDILNQLRKILCIHLRCCEKDTLLLNFNTGAEILVQMENDIFNIDAISILISEVK